MRQPAPGPNRVRVEIVAYAPTIYTQCPSCEVVEQAAGMSDRLHDEQRESSLPADLAREYRHVRDWASGVLDAFGDRLDVAMIDAASIQGLCKRLRHRIRRYPAVIVDGQLEAGGGRLPDPQELGRLVRASQGGVDPCSRA